MPVFEYLGLDSGGKKVKGNVDADNARVARQKLQGQKIYVTDLQESLEKAASAKASTDILKYFQTTRISTKELVVITRQLATLLNAGLPLVTALQAVSEQCDTTTARRTFINLKERVEEGSTFANALAQFPRSFPRLFINMIHSGEASGTLDGVLLNLADYLEKQLALKQKVRAALTYPLLMLSFSGLVVLGLFIFVIPKVVDMFKQQGLELPLPTQIMIGISSLLLNYGWLLPVMAVFAVMGLNYYYKTPNGRSKIDQLLLRLPIFGPIYIKVTTARTALTMSALLGSGVQLLSALEISRRMVGNVHFEKALDSAREGVQEGRSLARELKESGLYPSMLCQMIAVGEKSGSLEEMLDKAGKAYEGDVNATLGTLTTVLEPLLMIFVGMIVFCIVIAILLPMADLVDKIK